MCSDRVDPTPSSAPPPSAWSKVKPRPRAVARRRICNFFLANPNRTRVVIPDVAWPPLPYNERLLVVGSRAADQPGKVWIYGFAVKELVHAYFSEHSDDKALAVLRQLSDEHKEVFREELLVTPDGEIDVVVTWERGQ